METYEAKYKDLVKRLNKAREEKGVYTFNSVLDAVAPELKIDESEYERIRKGLVVIFTDFESLYLQENYSLSKEDILAWLEKQKIKEHNVCDTCDEKASCANPCPVKLVEQNPWSEEDKKIVLSIEQVMNCASLFNIVPEKVNKIRTWLKSIKDRVLPQPKQEWSDEDEEYLKLAIELFQMFGNPFLIAWIKSLKERCTYKPSKEQMKALYDSIPENVFEISEREQLLESLYQDLKKLREE